MGGGGKKQLAKEAEKIAATKDAALILKSLKNIFSKESEEILQPFANELVSATDKKVVEKMINNFSKVKTISSTISTKNFETIIKNYDNPKAVVSIGQKPNAVLTFGPPASGKSTIANELKNNHVVVDADEIKKILVKDYGIKSPAEAHKTSSKLAEDIFYQRVKESKNVVYNGSGANLERYQKMLDILRKKGYNVEGRSAMIPEELSLKRTMARNLSNNRGVPLQIVREDYNQIINNREQLFNNFDNFKFYDTTGKEPKFIPEITTGGRTGIESSYTRGGGRGSMESLPATGKGNERAATEAINLTKNQNVQQPPISGNGAVLNLNKKITLVIPDSKKYVTEQIAKRETAKTAESPRFLSGVKNLYNEAKKKLVDFAAPIEDVLRATEKKYKFNVLPKADITNQIDRVLRTPTIAGQFVKDNGLESIIKNVDNLDFLDQYLIAKHAQTLESKGIQTGRNIIKDQQLIKDFAPLYEETAKQVNQYSQKLLDYSVDSGLISSDLAAKLKQMYPDYVPMNRVFTELEKTGGQGSKAIASLSKQTVVQKIVGSTREIESPLNSLLQKTSDVFKQGEKNKAARILAGYKNLPSNPFQLKELADGETAQHTISFLDNGIKRTFETTSDIANAAKALNVQQLNILGKIFALPVRIAKIGITGINLPFIASNIAKDQVTAVINSKNALRTSIANPVVFIKSLFEAIGHGQLYDEMARQGAMGTSFDIARNQVTQTVERLRAKRNIGSRILYTVKHPSELLRAVENIVSRGEEFTRIQQYAGTKQASLAKGMGVEDAKIIASRAARENTVNFARRGEWGQVLNSAFLYLNAGIQGTRTFVRNLSQRPIATASKLALTVFTPIAIATAWNLSDPQRKAAYDDIAEYEKQNNIIIIPPNPTKDKNGNWNVIKIPLSQEINNIAGMARRPIEQAYGLDPVSVKDVISAFAGTVSPINPTTGSIASSLTPQAIKPSIEALTNKNLFTGYNQVPQSMEKLSPAMQVKQTTSGTVRKMGQLLNLSPIKIEEFIKGTMGGVGSQVLNASDKILAGLDIIPKDQIGGQNVIKAILARFATARGGQSDEKSNKQLQNIIQKQADEGFRLKQEAEILYSELKNLSKDQANAKASELKQKNPQLYEKLKTVVDEQKKGLDYNDRLIMQLQVTNGERAKFIWENLKALKTKEEKNNYVSDLRKKGIISDNVMDQLRQLKEKGY